MRHPLDGHRHKIELREIRIPEHLVAVHEGRADLFEVSFRTHLAFRNAVHRFAIYFKREFGYDFIQYDPQEFDVHSKDVAYLWMDQSNSYPKGLPIGAVSFRWREWTNHEPTFALQWIWLHPYERCKGHVRAAWPFFQKQHGDFVVEPPLSPAMKAFLKKVDPDKLKPYEMETSGHD